MLKERGIPVIDADKLAREVVGLGTPGLEKIKEAFGPEVLEESGVLDREAMGKLVFADSEKRALLNSIIHPLIGARSLERFAELSAANNRWIVYEAALIVENNLVTKLGMAALIVVVVSEKTQLARLMARNQFSESEARARLASQLSTAEKIAVADIVIDNNGSLATTRAQLDRHWTELVDAHQSAASAGDSGQTVDDKSTNNRQTTDKTDNKR